MAANTVLNYLPRQSVVHKMTGTTKLAFFLLFTFASMITYNTWVLLGLMAVSFAAFKLSHIKLREVRFMMIFMLVFLLLNNLFIFLFDPNQGTTLYGTRHVLFHLFWRYDVTAEQLFYMVKVENARFSKQVVPGDVLILDVRMKRLIRNMGWYSGEAKVNGEVVACADILCAGAKA